MDIMFHKHSGVISSCFLVFRLIIQWALRNSYFISETSCVYTTASVTIDIFIFYGCQATADNTEGGHYQVFLIII